MNSNKTTTTTNQTVARNRPLDVDVSGVLPVRAELMRIDEAETRRMRASVSENLITAVKVRSAADIARQAQGEFSSLNQVESALLKSCDSEAQVRRLNQITHEAALEIALIMIDGMERIKHI